MDQLIDDEINEAVAQFVSRGTADNRYSSFDYCYNYFRTAKNPQKDIEKSCLVLGFYLASWGMFRGSSFLLQKSAKHFEPLITYVCSRDRSLWSIDVDVYTDENIETILDVYREIRDLLISDGNQDVVLTTKVLLGVFGFVPAFDSYFSATFRNLYRGQCGFRRVNKESLNLISDFYKAHKKVIDGLSSQTFTTDFNTGQKTPINYPKAKIIDMYGFTSALPTAEPLVRTR